ncbi:dihydrofolate reductase family protein [Pseudonocardia sp. DLS-67]
MPIKAAEAATSPPNNADVGPRARGWNDAMRSVVLYELISLDGVAEEPGEGEWFTDADERLMGNLVDIIGRQDTVLLGRRTYEKWARQWPNSTMQPFADFINTTPKILFSASAARPDWSATTQVTDPAAHYVADLKRRAGNDIGIHGSLTLARTLLRERLVDELRLVVSPSLAGRGRRLFDETSDLQRFSLVSADRSGGCLLLHYRSHDAPN